jgi:hypothetical protein
MIKVRMIEGGYEHPDSALDYYLAPVALPMTIDVWVDELEDTVEVTLRNEDDLKQWAAGAFHEYRIWTMTVPDGAIVEGIVVPDGCIAVETCTQCNAVLDDVNERTDEGCDECDPRDLDERIHV